MGILGSLIAKREPAVQYRTVDGGHPAPFPDMTDEQLYNYEMTFNVARKTFDRPPPAARRPAARAAKPAANQAFDAPRYTARAAGTEAVQTDRTGPERIEPDDRSAEGSGPDPLDPAPAEQPLAGQPLMPALPLDLDKPVRTITTRQPVEILTTRARHPVYKVHGYIGDDDIVTVFTLDGRLSETGPQFLENVPQMQELHLNIYRNRDPYAKEKYLVTQHGSKEAADASAQAERLACVAVPVAG